LTKGNANGSAYIVGDLFTVADITGMAALVVPDFLEVEILRELRI
jgi:hypothetical protein